MGPLFSPSIFPLYGVLLLVLAASVWFALAERRKRTLEFIFVFEDADVVLPQLDDAYVRSRFGDTGSRRGLLRVLKVVEQAQCAAVAVFDCGTGRHMPRERWSRRMKELGLQSWTARKRLAHRDAVPGAVDPMGVLGMVIRVSNRKLRMAPDHEVSETLEFLRTIPPGSPLYVYLAPDPGGILSRRDALAFVQSVDREGMASTLPSPL